MFSWQIRTQKERPTSFFWYLGWGIFTIALFGAAIWEKSPLTIILFSLVSAIVILFKEAPHKKIDCRITKKGVFINQEFHLYSALQSFSISKRRQLYLKSKQKLMPSLTIPIISEIDKTALKRFLKTKLPYEKQADFLLENLKTSLGI